MARCRLSGFEFISVSRTVLLTGTSAAYSPLMKVILPQRMTVAAGETNLKVNDGMNGTDSAGNDHRSDQIRHAKRSHFARKSPKKRVEFQRIMPFPLAPVASQQSSVEARRTAAAVNASSRCLQSAGYKSQPALPCFSILILENRYAPHRGKNHS